MVCGNCGATVADKAIVCYRCGTPTALPAPPPRKTPEVSRPWLLIVVLFALAGVMGWLAALEPSGDVRQILLAVVGLAAVAWGGHLAWHGWKK